MLQQTSGTIFSFRRGVPQQIDEAEEGEAVLPAQSIFVQGDSRISCSLRRITASGALLGTASPVQPGERLNLELTRGLSVDATVAWRSGSQVGISFDAELDVFGSIARALVNQPDERRRMPRIELRCTACIQTPYATEFATTRDISQGGLKLETGLKLEVGETLEISLDGLPTLSGEVRWRDNGIAGIEFTSEIGWQVLMPWVRAMSLMSDTPARSAPPTRAAPAADDDSVHLAIPARVREGTQRWNVIVNAIDENQVEFSTFAALRLDTLVWLILPELEGWAARIVRIGQDRYVAAFTTPLRPALVGRLHASARRQR